MRAEIVAVGSELTSGAKLDTNSQWLSQQLATFGISVAFHTTVGDSYEDQLNSLKIACGRVDLVIMTGGLGPTKDDLAREIIAKLAGVELVLDPPSLETIREMYALRKREMPEINRIQAMFPEGSEPLLNPIGTAPGVWMSLVDGEENNGEAKSSIAALPGVPSEMKRMFLEQVVPRLPKSNITIRHALIHCFGVGESAAEEMLGEITERSRDPEVGITVSDATITLRINAMGSTEEECILKIDSTRTLIYERMGELIFGEEEDQIQNVVYKALLEKNKTISTVEVGVMSGLAHELSESNLDDPASSAFQSGVNFPSWSEVEKSLDSPTLTDSEDENRSIVENLAKTCRVKYGTDFSLTTYIPKESNDNSKAYVALSTAEGEFSERIHFLSTLQLQKARTMKTALNLLRLHLQK